MYQFFPQNPMPTKCFHTLAVCSVLVCMLVPSNGLLTKCHKYSDTYTGGQCKDTSFSFNRCADPDNLLETETKKAEADKGASDFTEAQCKADATAYDSEILKPGCVAMGGVLEGETKCVKSVYCNRVQQKATLTSVCDADVDCPTTKSIPTTFKTCCATIEKHLEKRCSKHDEVKKVLYIDTLIKGGHCSAAECVSAGISVRAAHVFTFLIITMTLFLTGTQ